MAEEAKRGCSCVIDTSGLHRIATASGNLKVALLARLQDGTIAVPTWTWQEFRTLFDDEATAIEPHVTARLQFSTQVGVRAARITEDQSLGFSRGAYDNHVELFCASIALNKGFTVLTSADNLEVYDTMGCEAQDLESWAEN